MGVTADELVPLETRKKSGVAAALLNILLPGAGYMYCGHWILGACAFVFVVTAAIISFGYAVGVLWLVLVIDGFLSAEEYNEHLLKDAVR